MWHANREYVEYVCIIYIYMWHAVAAFLSTDVIVGFDGGDLCPMN